MSIRTLEFSVGEYYHLYQRGVNKDKIFIDEHDRLRLLLNLHTANFQEAIHLSDYWGEDKNPEHVFSISFGKRRVNIGAYCFMPNHIHLLVKEEKEGGISGFMQKLTTGYSMYFNKKYNRTGSLWERPFKAKHIDNDTYLQYMFAYIHLNPVKIKDPEGWRGKKIKDQTKAKEFLKNYRYSSYLYYTGISRSDDAILNSTVFPKYFDKKHKFEDFLQDWMTIEEDTPNVKATP